MKSSVLTLLTRPTRRHVIWDYSACVWMSFCVCTLLLWANVILAEMSARFLRTHMRDLGCACAWMLGDNAICSVLLSLWSWSVAMWCGWYICAMSGYCVWSSLALVRLEANAVLNRFNSSFSHSFELPDSVDILRGRNTADLCQGVTFLFSSTILFIILAHSSLSLPHFDLLFSRSLRLNDLESFSPLLWDVH